MFNQYKKVLKRYVNFFGTKLVCILHTQPIWKWANHISSAYYPHSACGHHIIRSSSHLLRRLREGWEHPGTAPPIWQHGALCCGPQGNGTNTCEPLLSPRRDGAHFSDCGTSPSQQPVHGRGCPHFIGGERGLNRFSNCAKWPECRVVGWIDPIRTTGQWAARRPSSGRVDERMNGKELECLRWEKASLGLLSTEQRGS